MSIRDGIVTVYNDFTGGLNDTVPPDSMHDNELRQADNVLVNQRGGFTYRFGLTKLNTNSYGAKVTQLFEWILSNGTCQLMACYGGVLYQINENGTSSRVMSLNGSATSIGYFVFKDMLYFSDGSSYKVWGWYDFLADTNPGTSTSVAVGQVVKNFPASTGGGVAKHYYRCLVAGSYNLGTTNYGTTSTWSDITESVTGLIPDNLVDVKANTATDNDLAPIKKCKYFMWHPPSFRIFASGNPDDPTCLYYCEPNDPSYFKKTSKLYPTTSCGPVTGIRTLLKSLMVSYQTSWRVWNGTDLTNMTWKEVPLPTGCVANDAMCLTPNTLTFLGHQGLNVVNPSIVNDEIVMVVAQNLFGELSKNKVENELKSIANRGMCKMCYSDGMVFLAYNDSTNQTTNTKVLAMDWDTKAFVRFTGWEVNCWCPRNNGDLLFASRNYILKYDHNATDDIDVATGLKKPIKLTVATKPFSLGKLAEIFFNKFVNYIYVSAKQFSEINYSYATIKLISDYNMKTGQTQATSDLNESLLWGASWGKVYGFSELCNQWQDVKSEGLRHQVIVEAEFLGNKLNVYAIGFNYDLLQTKATMIPKSPLI